ncbi:Oligopeptide transporter OPT superfamily [Cordyceps fumosorosea ARSEF 2679]|uniref:Oligopeptide transporter OPT superfamily n=1 Tax=Cordyceps fumosorosea (strain ARSEF 2679) TaxID=1081104 RepID=A0A167XC71_CORFA|nr:Oligopeptide transporter OPT superfamily [Cordyceps fumosorosea ARSEF 2679]OAA64789.1 Oligopeptide transporter OPT superfamily [Cordyceps fumosorosea ARSEF 2679]
MAEHGEKRSDIANVHEEPRGGIIGEKEVDAAVAAADDERAEHDLNVTEDDLLEAKELAATFSLEGTRDLMTQVYKLHRRDPNFPQTILERIEEFLQNDNVFDNPEKHEQLIAEMKIEAALITNNSPYAEVRAVVSNRDDPTMPCSTIRAWVIGIFFSIAIAFINGFFEIRQPAIYVTANVPQLLAYPVGKLWEKVLPDVGFTLFGVRHSLNPGPFNRKEHMLITIMAAISKSSPYTNYVIFIQYLPNFFNQSWALSFGYQILIALSTNFIGYSLAGICRRFLVYPSYCVWPQSLVTIALNSAFHADTNPAVPGPFGTFWRMSRLKFFVFAFAAMFVWFWFPNYIFQGLALFTWMAWIAPNNAKLAVITGASGLGLNPLPTFDWNIVTFMTDPLMLPFFSAANNFAGMAITLPVVAAMYYGNAWGGAYLPINSNKPYDRFAKRYNVTRILDDRGIMDIEKYKAYSPPYLSSANTLIYMMFFGAYSAVVTYAILFHRIEIMMGFRDLINSFRPSKKQEIEEGRVLDVHNRLMKAYKEVPEWWYFCTLVFAVAIGCTAIAVYPTHTSVGVVFYGVLLCLIFVVPVGIVYAMTGVEVTLNVLAQFIGGSFVEGNALAMCFFKTYGYVTCAHALAFSNDLKMAHYVKIPPRFTFFAQMVPSLITTFVYVGIVQFQVNLKDVCTANAPFRFTCPGINTFFTAAVMWGTVGPKRLWGVGGTYTVTLLGFPLGVAIVLAFWVAGRKWPKSAFIRNIHPVVIMTGGLHWAPYNLSYMWPAVPVAAFSWLYVRKRFLGFWSKYNFVLSAAFSAGIAISGLIQFFGLAYNNIEFNWWGNSVVGSGCDDGVSCPLMKLAPGEYFGPGLGEF